MTLSEELAEEIRQRLNSIEREIYSHMESAVGKSPFDESVLDTLKHIAQILTLMEERYKP